MAKVNANYEVVYIMDPAMGEEAIAAMIEKFKALVETEGTVTAIDDWGKRKLAYSIKKRQHGFYVIFYYKAEAATVASVEAALKLNENVLRWMTLADYPMSEIVYDQTQTQSTEEIIPVDAEEGEAE